MVELSCIICGGNVLSAGIGEETRSCPTCGKHIVRRHVSEQTEELMRRAYKERSRCDFAAAIRSYNEVLSVFPDTADARFGIAICRHGVVFGQSDGKTRIGIVRYLNESFSASPSVLWARELAPSGSKENFDLFSAAIEREKNTFSKIEDMKPCDAVICCASEKDENGDVSESYKEACELNERFLRQGIRCTVISKPSVALDRRMRAELFNAERTAFAVVNILSSEAQASDEPMSYFNSTSLSGASGRKIITLMTRGSLASMTKSRRRSVRVMLTPEDRTELALEIEEYLRENGRFTSVEPLPSEEGRCAAKIKQAFSCLSDGKFDDAEDIFNAVLMAEKSDVSALWGLFLCANRVSNAVEALGLDGEIKGREPLGRLMRYGTEETVSWVKRFIKTLTFNIHIKFLSSYRKRDREKARFYAEAYRSFDADGVLNDVHNVFLQTLGGSSRKLLTGAVLQLLSYYRELPFSAGSKNVSLMASYYTELRTKQLKEVVELFISLPDSGNSSAKEKLVREAIDDFCLPYGAFFAYSGVPMSKFGFTEFAEPENLYFFIAQALEASVTNPNACQIKEIDRCFEKAERYSSDQSEVFRSARIRRSEENKRAEELRQKNTPHRLRNKLMSLFAVDESTPVPEKKGFTQTLFMCLLFLLSLTAVGAGIFINAKPDFLLRFSRFLFVTLSTGASLVCLGVVGILSRMLFKARKSRKHRLVGKAVLAFLPIVSVLCATGALTLSIISAATFSARMPLVYIANSKEFLFMSNYPSGNFRLVSDIELDGQSIEGLKRFNGTFDGAGHTLMNFSSSGFLLEKNTGLLTNFTVEDATVDGFVRENNGVIRNVTVRNTSFDSASCVKNNGTVNRCRFEGNTVYGGGFIKENTGTVSEVSVTDLTLSCSPDKVCVLGDTYYTGGFVGINEGIVTDCVVSSVSVHSDNKKAHIGGVFGINISSVSRVTADKIRLNGNAVSSGLFAARNTGSVSEASVSGDVAVTASRSFGGFVGENTRQLSHCKSKVYGEITLVSDNSVRSCSGGFIGSSSGIVTDCESGGKMSFKCETDDKTTVYSGGTAGLVEARMSKIVSDVSTYFYCRKKPYDTETYIGGVAGCIKNTSVDKIARTGREIIVINELEDSVSGNHSKYQPKFHVGGFAGAVLSDNDHKNETISAISVNETVRFNAKNRTFVNFGSLFGYLNCNHIISEAVISGAFSVCSNGYEKVSFGVITGRGDSVEKIEGVAFTGYVAESGTNTSSISFTGGSDKAYIKCYARDNCGTSATGAQYVPEAVFFSEAFYSDTLGWNPKSWSLKNGHLPELKISSNSTR